MTAANELEQKLQEWRAKTSRRLGGQADPTQPPYLNSRQAAARLGGISPTTLIGWTTENNIPATIDPVDKRLRLYPTAAIEALLDDGRRFRLACRQALHAQISILKLY